MLPLLAAHAAALDAATAVVEADAVDAAAGAVPNVEMSYQRVCLCGMSSLCCQLVLVSVEILGQCENKNTPT